MGHFENECKTTLNQQQPNNNNKVKQANAHIAIVLEENQKTDNNNKEKDHTTPKKQAFSAQVVRCDFTNKVGANTNQIQYNPD